KWLGQDLVIWRSESGKLSVMDAYCPHMGAHLGHVGQFGGKVCGESIACPWHGWRWDAEGKNVEIPYMKGETVNKRIDVKHAREIDGIVILWFDSAGAPPNYEWPGIPYLGDRSNYYPIDATVDGPHRVKPQFPFENSADPHHFPYVHGSGVDAEFTDYIIEGALIRNTMNMLFGAGKPRTWMTPNGPVEGTIDNFCWGTSLGVARFNIEGRVCVHLTFVTPIDAEESVFFSTVTHTRGEGEDGDVPVGTAKKMMDAQHVQIRHDFHIWQNMRYRVKPIFTGEDERTRYAFLRRHFDQFYPNPVYAENRAQNHTSEAAE
ncbi:MAG: Rieske 2Fe-2S domain-containing protein, partial [Sphingomonadaceae bacterium]|nr:Rieske 2Fe-2S domain-containing protein [Sphingomonadaceae bacterium]